MTQDKIHHPIARRRPYTIQGRASAAEGRHESLVGGVGAARSPAMTAPDDASSSATARRRAHRDRLPSNLWNRTRRGIICVPRALRFKARRAAQNRHMSIDYFCTERGDAHIQILTAFLAGGGLISGFDYGITKGARLQATASCFGHQTWWWFGCWGTARRVRTVHNTLRHRAITGRCCED